MTCGVYEIVNKFNGKRYVGSSVNIESRWANHRSQLKHGKHHSPALQRAWDKYGENSFIFSVILECGADAVLCNEQVEIDFKSEYNIAPTATLGNSTPKTDAQKIAASERMKKFYSLPENKEKLDRMRGRHNTDEVRASISAGTIRGQSDPAVRKVMSDKAKKSWECPERLASQSVSAKERISRPEHKAAVIEANSGKNNRNYNHKVYNFTHEEYGSISCTQWELRNKYGLRHSNLSQVCSGQKGSHNGWTIKKRPHLRGLSLSYGAVLRAFRYPIGIRRSVWGNKLNAACAQQARDGKAEGRVLIDREEAERHGQVQLHEVFGVVVGENTAFASSASNFQLVNTDDAQFAASFQRVTVGAGNERQDGFHRDSRIRSRSDVGKRSLRQHQGICKDGAERARVDAVDDKVNVANDLLGGFGANTSRVNPIGHTTNAIRRQGNNRNSGVVN